VPSAPSAPAIGATPTGADRPPAAARRSDPRGRTGGTAVAADALATAGIRPTPPATGGDAGRDPIRDPIRDTIRDTIRPAQFKDDAAPASPLATAAAWDTLVKEAGRAGSLPPAPSWPSDLPSSADPSRSGAAYLDFSPPPEAPVLPTGRPATGRLLDRRSSAALPAPEIDADDRRNAVSLSLAGLFEDAEDPGATAERLATAEPQQVRKPSAYFDAASLFEDEPEAAPTPTRRPRTALSPFGIVALLAIAVAFWFVAVFVMRSHPNKPLPASDQVPSATQ